MAQGVKSKPLEPQQITEIERLAQIGCTWEQIGAWVKIHHRTLRKNPLAKDAYQRGVGVGIASIAAVLFNAAKKGEPWAVQLFLRTRGGWRDGISAAQQNGDEDERHPNADAVIGIQQRLARIREVQAEVVKTEITPSPEPPPAPPAAANG